MKGKNVDLIVWVVLEDIVNFGKVQVIFLVGKIVNVILFKGVQEGEKICLKGQGYFGMNGGLVGDVMVEICFKLYLFFEVKGVDLYLDLLIIFYEVVFGVKVCILILIGVVNFIVLENVLSGKLMCLKGKGLLIKIGGYGDFLVKLQIVLLLYGDLELEIFMKVWKEIMFYCVCGLEFD